jgi:DNA topoisomerase-1
LKTTLIIAEKPDAALHVAEALSTNEPFKAIRIEGVPFFEVQAATEHRILVCSALGHLYVVAAAEPGLQSSYPVWKNVWKPKHLVERGRGRHRSWIQAITKASKEADYFVDACDFDLEGSVIGYTILKYACQGADRVARRMKFSTLTEAELRDAYANALPHLDFPLINAGMCRHEVDWLFGINLSRALTQAAYKTSGRYSTLSTGRVQGPTLRFLFDREVEIETFVPAPYWVLKVLLDIDGKILPADYEAEKLQTKTDALEVVENCDGNQGVVETLDSAKYHLAPPTPFDLSTFQGEAYRHFGLSPRISLAIAERLYLDQLISYPRTSSQKLPASIGYERILRNLEALNGYRSHIEELLASGMLVPTQGKKEDPAHPAIYPTGALPKRHLDSREQRVFDLIVRRFLAAFGKAALKQSDKATIRVGTHGFLLHGSKLIEKGWTRFYKPYAKLEDINLPPLEKGQQVRVTEIKPEEKHTQPPPRYNPGSLLKKMEESEIGTKATRADIIETIFKRGYATGQRMTATPLAFRIIEILAKYCPKIVDVTFTRELEEKMAEIETEAETREHVVEDTVAYLKPIIETLKDKEKGIGEELTTVLTEMRDSTTTLHVACPQCGSALKIVRNPNTKKRFIGCSGKWKRGCKFSLPLPQFGKLTLLQRCCPDCGFQLVQVKSKGRSLVTCCRCYAGKRRPLPRIKPSTITPK